MYEQTINNNQQYLPAVLRAFAISLGIAFIGTLTGQFIPPVLFIPLVVLELVMLLGAFFLRRRKAISYPFLYVFTFISGITTYPIVSYYVSTVGGNVVLMALGTTTTVFAGLAVYASTTKRDLSFLGGILMAALLALIAISIFQLFFPVSTNGMLAYSFIGVLVFSGYVLYDINRIKKHGLTAEEVPLMALNLYLDFVNLFISILRILGILSSRD
ncbi:Bax inhibitor-1/YccA family protein [Bacillaceae bacterium Marseille-Q3522]|nr:Bax inhibitor-1/YccA family protein [Bacillaceae bacterium Marseille-Q3522]